jgi:hypothetical protein
VTRIRRCRPSCEHIRLELLSWGFPKTPLHRDKNRASTPGWFPTLRPEDANLVLVPSLPFLPASTVCSARSPAGLLHPAPDHGVRLVSGDIARTTSRRNQRSRTLPETAHHTLQSFSLDRSRAASPRPLPSRRSRVSRMSRSDHKALLHCRVRCFDRRCRRPSPDALLGFVPLQGPPRTLRRREPFEPESSPPSRRMEKGVSCLDLS